MTKRQRLLLIFLIVTSPVVISSIDLLIFVSPGEGVNSLGPILGLVFGIPAIVIIGMALSFLTRNKNNTSRLTAIYYLIPALVVCALVLKYNHSPIY